MYTCQTRLSFFLFCQKDKIRCVFLFFIFLSSLVFCKPYIIYYTYIKKKSKITDTLDLGEDVDVDLSDVDATLFMNMHISSMEVIISDREMDFQNVGYLNSTTTRRMRDMMGGLRLDNNNMNEFQIESNEYIIQSDWAITNLFIEYYSIIIIIECLIFSLFAKINGDVTTANLWQQFTISYKGTEDICIWYTICGAILWCLDDYLFTFGAFKVDSVSANVVSVLEIFSVFFTLILDYVWLNETPNYLESLATALIVIGIVICVYPWEKIIQGSQYENIFKNF